MYVSYQIEKMEIYLIVFLLFLALIAGFVFWIYKVYKLFKKGRNKAFYINLTILCIVTIFITWQLEIFPLSKNFYFKERTTELTGKTFWSWKDYMYDELSVRGEGYTLEIYEYNDDIAAYFKNPDSIFFTYPRHSDIKWQKTPVAIEHQKILEFVTPVYNGWEGEILNKQDYIRKIANSSGSFYSFVNSGRTDFYIIAPHKNLIILINHNM